MRNWIEVVLGSLLWAAVIGPAAAQSPGPAGTAPAPGIKAVLELFTSQGCSSCPPADALLQRYSARSDVVALTFPVDYWDYLGWKDTLASPKFSARQRSYAKDRGDGRIYTPQVVVNGIAHANGSSERDIEQAISGTASRFQKTNVPLSVVMEKDHLVVTASDAPSGSDVKEATIWLAVLQKEVEVPVRSGENRGRTLKYFNVVKELTPIGMWSGKAARFELLREAVIQPGVGSCAILVQHGKAGPIIGAAMMPIL